MGYDPPFTSEMASYVNMRGNKVEEIGRGLLIEWSELNEIPYSKEKQTTVGMDETKEIERQLEFVCEIDDVTFGFDITRSDSSTGVEDKWKKRKYQDHVKQFVVVVVSNKWNESQYKYWNLESPENVKIINYKHLETFLNELKRSKEPFTIPLEINKLLDAYAYCTFDNAEETKQKYQRGKRGDPQIRIDEYPQKNIKKRRK